MSTPEGSSTVAPYLLVENVHEQIQFLAHVFGAEVKQKLKNPDGSIMHASLSIGNVTIMIGSGEKENPSLQSMCYVYVKDCEKTFERAIKHGASVIIDPAEQFYGTLEAGVQDPQGNQWWIAQVLETLSSEEVQSRLNDLSEEEE